MAYREFQNEKIYEAPQVGDLPRTLQALQTVQQYQNQKQQRLRDAAKDVAIFEAKGEHPINREMIQKKAGEVALHRQNEIYHERLLNPSAENIRKQNELLQWQGISSANESEAKNIQSHIIEKSKDKYFKPERIQKEFNQLFEDPQGAHLNDPEGFLWNQSQRISNLRNSIGHRDYTNEDFNLVGPSGYVPDWIKSFGETEAQNSNKDANGIKVDVLRKAPLVDERGNPSVTNRHILNFIKSDERIEPYIQHEVLGDYNQIVDQNIAHDPKWLEKTGFQNKADAIEMLSKYPERNLDFKTLDANGNPTLNQSSYGTVIDDNGKKVNKILDFSDRLRERSRQILQDYNHSASKTSADYSDYNPANSWGIRDKHASLAEGYDNSGEMHGPSLTIRDTSKSSGSYNLSVKPNLVVDTDNGKVFKNINEQDFNLKRLKIVLLDKDGRPIPVKGETIEDYYNAINAMPLEKFKNAKWSWGAEGQAINKKDVASAIDKLHSGEQTPEITALLDKLKNFTEGTILNGNEQALLQKTMGVNIVTNEMFPFDKDDHADQQIRSAVPGANPYSPKILKGEFKKVADLFQSKINEATSPGEEAAQKYMKSSEGRKFVQDRKRIRLEEQRNKLKTSAPHGDQVNQNGTTYIWDGKEYVAKD